MHSPFHAHREHRLIGALSGGSDTPRTPDLSDLPDLPDPGRENDERNTEANSPRTNETQTQPDQAPDLPVDAQTTDRLHGIANQIPGLSQLDTEGKETFWGAIMKLLGMKKFTSEEDMQSRISDLDAELNNPTRDPYANALAHLDLNDDGTVTDAPSGVLSGDTNPTSPTDTTNTAPDDNTEQNDTPDPEPGPPIVPPERDYEHGIARRAEQLEAQYPGRVLAVMWAGMDNGMRYNDDIQLPERLAGTPVRIEAPNGQSKTVTPGTGIERVGVLNLQYGGYSDTRSLHFYAYDSQMFGEQHAGTYEVTIDNQTYYVEVMRMSYVEQGTYMSLEEMERLRQIPGLHDALIHTSVVFGNMAAENGTRLDTRFDTISNRAHELAQLLRRGLATEATGDTVFIRRTRLIGLFSEAMSTVTNGHVQAQSLDQVNGDVVAQLSECKNVLENFEGDMNVVEWLQSGMPELERAWVNTNFEPIQETEAPTEPPVFQEPLKKAIYQERITRPTPRMIERSETTESGPEVLDPEEVTVPLNGERQDLYMVEGRELQLPNGETVTFPLEQGPFIIDQDNVDENGFGDIFVRSNTDDFDTAVPVTLTMISRDEENPDTIINTQDLVLNPEGPEVLSPIVKRVRLNGEPSNHVIPTRAQIQRQEGDAWVPVEFPPDGSSIEAGPFEISLSGQSLNIVSRDGITSSNERVQYRLFNETTFSSQLLDIVPEGPRTLGSQREDIPVNGQEHRFNIADGVEIRRREGSAWIPTEIPTAAPGIEVGAFTIYKDGNELAVTSRPGATTSSGSADYQLYHPENYTIQHLFILPEGPRQLSNRIEEIQLDGTTQAIGNLSAVDEVQHYVGGRWVPVEGTVTTGQFQVVRNADGTLSVTPQSETASGMADLRISNDTAFTHQNLYLRPIERKATEMEMKERIARLNEILTAICRSFGNGINTINGNALDLDGDGQRNFAVSDAAGSHQNNLSRHHRTILSRLSSLRPEGNRYTLSQLQQIDRLITEAEGTIRNVLDQTFSPSSLQTMSAEQLTTALADSQGILSNITSSARDSFIGNLNRALRARNITIIPAGDGFTAQQS